MTDVAAPFFAIFGLFIIFIAIIFAMPILGSAAPISAQDSANLVSSGTNISYNLGLFAVLIVGAVSVLVIDRRGR